MSDRRACEMISEHTVSHPPHTAEARAVVIAHIAACDTCKNKYGAAIAAWDNNN